MTNRAIKKHINECKRNRELEERPKTVSNNLKDRPISNPSSNRPEFCGVCQECLWTYDMELHYDSKHSGVECPENFLISADEREKVLNFKR